MARLRLFANLRELAGVSTVEVEGDTVGSVLDRAVSRYGEEFGRGLGAAKVWLNGDPAGPEDRVGASDEIALIPPVSGGAGPVLTVEGIGLLLIAVALLGANALSDPAWIVAALVGAGGLWVWDLTGEAEGWRPFRLPGLLAALGGGVITYGFEVAELQPAAEGLGLGVAAAFAVVAALAGGVLSPRHRGLVPMVTTVVLSVVVAMAVGSLVLVRILGPQGQELLWVFLALAIVGRGTAALLARSPTPTVDPLTGAVLATVLAAVIASFLVDVSIFALFLIGVLLAIGLVAGTTLGSVARVGEVYLTDPVEGALVALDGPVMAATMYAPFVVLLL